MAIDRDNCKEDDKKAENNTGTVSSIHVCSRCNSAIESSEEMSQNGQSNQIVLDAVPRFLVDKTFTDDDETEWRVIEEREKKAREELERKKTEETERRRMSRILDMPSTSQSTHLEDYSNYMSENQNDGQKSSTINDKVKVVANSNNLEKPDLYNRRPLRANSNTYELENFGKNVMLIFNQYNIDSYTKPREGTHKDVESLEKTFSKYNFMIVEYKDKTRDEIFDILDHFSNSDFSEFGCVSVVVLSHGWDGGILWAKDVTYNESEILQRFETHKNPSLVTKPKLFIFQACRGRHPSQSIKVHARTVRLDGDEEDFFYTLPIESDVLILHSTYPGNASHRETEHGSWMIQTLCARINQLADKDDLLSIVTRVQRDVAVDKENPRLNKWTAENRIDKQMPIMTSTLIRKLELRKYSPKPQSPKQTETDSAGVNGMRIVNGIDLNYFDYIRKCTAIFSEEIENLNDDFAKCLLNLSGTFGDSQQFDDTKMAMANAMCEYLERKVGNKEAYKYIYLKRC